MAKNASRVNGRHGESMWVTDDELCFRTANKVQRMARSEVKQLSLMNTEDARKLVQESDLVPYGSWTDEMPSGAGKSLFLVAANESDCWVMEITKAQVNNAHSFVSPLAPIEGESEGDKKIPTKAIETPLGGVLVIGEVACIFGAIFALYNFQQPVVAIILGIVACIMFFKVK